MKSGRPPPLDIGPFALLRFLGRGGTGEVWLGKHTESGAGVAVKILCDRGCARPASRERFQSEVQAIASLAHPSIVRLFDCGTVDDDAASRAARPPIAGSPFLVMELMDGGSIERRCGALSWEEIRVVLLQVLGALAHAHARGVIHRDIKPGNVLSTRDGTIVKLSDFGLATAPRAFIPTPADDPPLGTPAYMAPEQFSGTWRDHGPATDLYAVGGLACALVTGSPPFGPSTHFEAAREAHLCAAPPRLPPGCPAGFQEWVHVLMRKEPHRRFHGAADAAAALQKLRWAADRRRRVRVGRGGRGAAKAIGAVAAAAPPQTPLSGTGLGMHAVWTARMFGRDAECDTLWRLMETVSRDGRAKLAILRGPSGYGKSRLAEWLGERAAESGEAIFLAAMHSRTPGHSDGFRDMLGRLFRTHGLSRERAMARVFRWLEERGVKPHAFGPKLAEFVAPDRTAAAGAPGFGPGDRAGRFDTLVRLLRLLCADRPVVIWLDDAHWGAESLSFVRHLLSTQDDSPLPVLVVATATDEQLSDRERESVLLEDIALRPGVKTLTIGPIPPRCRPALVHDLLPLEQGLAALVDERTKGNPLFLVRLLGDWVAGGRLEQGPDGLRMRGGRVAELPDDLHQLWNDLVERALAGQPSETGMALELAAALGPDVSIDEWANVCAHSGVLVDADVPGAAAGHRDADVPAATRIEEIVDHLVVRRLARRPVERAERRFSFVHGMLRECLLRRAAAAGRLERHHRCCADMLLEQPGHGTGERRGRHLLAAGDGRAALEPLFTAAAARHLSGDFGLAEGLLAHAADAMALADLPRDDERRGEMLVRRARLSEYRGRISQAERWAVEALRLSGARAWPLVLGGALHELGRIRRVQGRLAEALRLLDKAVATTAHSGDHYREGHSELDRGRVLCNLGRIGEAAGAIEAARRIFDLHGFEVPSIWSRIALAEIFLAADDTGAALALAAGAEDQYTALDHLHGRAYSSAALALVLRHRGDLPEAEERCRYAIEQFDLLDHAEAHVQRLNLALILWEKGDAGPAGSILETQVSVFSADGRAIYEVRGRAFLAAAAAAARDWRRWDVEFGRVHSILRASGLVDPDVTRGLDFARRATGGAGRQKRARAALDAIQNEAGGRSPGRVRPRETP